MDKTNKMGIIYAALSYLLWGILPLYWKAIDNVPPFEILAHRIFWAFIFVGILIICGKHIKELIEVIKIKRNLIVISLSGAMVTINWGLYIWSVNSGHMVEASLGYYINPLVVVFFGVVFLKEKLSIGQISALILASCGVLFLTFQYGKFPWISVSLAVTFALYGLLKKLTNAGAIVSLFIETAMVTPLALTYIIFVQASGKGALGNISVFQTMLVVGAGIATAAPLMLFGLGAKRIPLSTLGFIQYISPTMSLFLGVFVFGEEFTRAHLISFGFIWLSLVVYTLSETKIFKVKRPINNIKDIS
ncbi:MAG: EamA family transporter RarD [Clostridium sp.]